MPAIKLRFVDFVPPAFLQAALAAWTMAFIGLLRQLAPGLRGHAVAA
ncbi:MAG TPA: hypothetical protein VJ834_10205 [Burkholderiales bacterium]|nr:hypothetical protein [Burkholderiales bacterium]